MQQRYRPSPPEDANGSWGGSNHRSTPGNFYPLMTRSMSFSDLAVTNFPPFPIAAPDQMLLLSGMIS
ncbi:hypothetical protein MNBD_ALPHA07-243, partial [hydrothermal vent metagenome]